MLQNPGKSLVQVKHLFFLNKIGVVIYNTRQNKKLRFLRVVFNYSLFIRICLILGTNFIWKISF